MHRRNILTGVLVGTGGLIAAAASAVRANAQAKPMAPDKSKVVYHLADADKVNFVLGNIRNHFDGVGGPEKVTMSMGYVYLRP